MKYSNNDEYDGNWKNDKREGKGNFNVTNIGIQIYSNGDKYEGDWINDKRSGKGNYVNHRRNT